MEASDAVQFEARRRCELYEWVSRTLREQGYERLARASIGLVRRYVAKLTGLSRICLVPRRFTHVAATARDNGLSKC